MEFGFEAGSFEDFKCTKAVSFEIKYMPLVLSQMKNANDDDRVTFKLPDYEVLTGVEFLIELETPTGIVRKITVELANKDEVSFVPFMVMITILRHALPCKHKNELLLQ